MFTVTPPHDPRLTLIKNESVKLSATYANTIAVSVFAVGGLAPIFSVLYSGTTAVRPAVVFSVSIVCCVASAILHIIARRILAKMVKP